MINSLKIKKSNKNTQIRSKLIIAFMGLALGPIVLLVCSFGFYEFTEFKTTALDKGRSTSFLVASEITRYFKNIEQTLKSTASLQDFTQKSEMGKRDVLQQLLSQHSTYKELSYVGPQEKERIRVSKNRPTHIINKRNLSGSEAFKATQKEQASYFGPIRFDENNGQPLMTIGIPLMDLQSNEYNGALIAELYIKPIFNMIADFNSNLNMNIYVLDKENKIVAHVNPSVVHRGTKLERTPTIGFQRGLSGQPSFLVSQKMILGKRDFLVVTEQDVLSAFTPNALGIAMFFIVILVAIVSAVVLMTFIIRDFIEPVRAVSKSVVRIAEGDLSERLAFNRNDEIGELANTFDQMAETIEKNHNLLGQEVAQRTKELASKVKELDFQKNALDEHAIVSIANVMGNITYANDKFCIMSGFSREELFGQNHRILNSGFHTDEFFTDLWRTIAKGNVWRGNIKNRKKEGGFYWVDATIVPFLDEQGKPFQYIAIRTDITKRMDAIEEAEKANKAKSDFLSSMSHELRTPLNAILGFGQLLEIQCKETLNEEAKSYITDILQAGHHLLELINQILDLSQIEAGYLKVSLEPIILEKVVTECITQMKAAFADQNKILITNQINDKNIVVMADSLLLRQVLINLLSNAVKYNCEGGTVTINAKPTSENRLCIKVTDTGQGIAASDMEKLFDPFERLSFKNASIEGSGIGLTVSRKLVLAMGGTIGLESELGEGTTFWIELPLAVGLPVSTT